MISVSTVRCPVSDIAGPDHYYNVGTGVIMPWDVMGDDRSSVEVCADCAANCVHDWEYLPDPNSETMRCVYCGEFQR